MSAWLALLATTALVMSGCGSTDKAEREPKREPDAWYSISIPLGDAYRVICVTNDLEDAISCNWDAVLKNPRKKGTK